MRHYLNIRILISEFYEFKTVGPYELNWVTEQYKSPLAHYVSTALLGCLQALNLFWLFAILRIAYRFVASNDLADDRSDAEDDEELEWEREGGQEGEGERKEGERLKEVEAVPSIEVNGSAVEGKGEASGAAPAGKAARRKA